MHDDRIHRAVSDDGTEIAGRVQGEGPPIVLVHGGLGDGETSWRFMLPFLVDHFTCYLMSTRGRGLSGDHADHSRERQFEDVAAYVRSIGEPAGVFGHSSGAVWVLGGAALAAAHVRGVALYEPPIVGPWWVISDEAIDRLTSAAAEGRMADAVGLAVSEIARLNDDDQAIFSVPPGSEIAEANIPVFVREAREINRPPDDAAFEKLTVPVLVLQGTRTGAHYKDAARHLTAQLDDARVVEIAGPGHMGPLTAAEAVAQELVRFFRG